MSLRDGWKKTGKDLGHAFQGLGKSIIRSVKTGADKADEWANAEEQPESTTAETKEAEPVDKPSRRNKSKPTGRCA